MNIALIFAASNNDVIGDKGKIPWDVPADGAYFHKMTTGHPVIMGRKTYEFIGKALPNRHNIVITSDPNYNSPGCTIVQSTEQALQAVQADQSDIFIIGGASIYKLFEPIADTVYQTRIHTVINDGDTVYKLDPKLWQLVAKESHEADNVNKLAYDFLTLKNKKLTTE